MAIYTPGSEGIIQPPPGGPRLNRSIAPGSYLPPEAHYELAAGIQAGLQGQTAILAEVSRTLRDIRAGLGAQAAYSSGPAASAARSALRVVNTADPDFVPTRPGPDESRAGRVVSTADVRAQSAAGLSSSVESARVATYSEGRRQGLAGLRAAVVSRAAQRISGMTFGGDFYEGVEVPAHYQPQPGEVFDPQAAAAAWHPPLAGDGSETHTVYVERQPDGTSRVVNAAIAGRAVRQISRANAVRTAVATVGQGGTLQAGVAAAAPRLAMGLGYAGMGVAALQQGYQFYAGQMAANRSYQRVLGGGISEGFGERFDQGVFRLRNALSFNPIGSSESDAIYQGALQTYAGDDEMRGIAQGAMADLYRATGMSPQESLRVIRIAAAEGNTALGQIAISLRNVTQTAREAGINAEQARERFARTYESLSSSIQGPAAAALAAAQTQAVTSMGMGFQHLGIDVSTQRNLLIGSPLGMTTGEVQNLQQSDPLRYAQLDQQSRRAYAEQILAGRGITSQIAEYLRGEGLEEGDAPNTRQRRELGEIVNAALPPALAVSYARNYLGLTDVDTSNAGEAIVLASMGYPDVAGEMEGALGEMGASDYEISSGDSEIGSDANMQRRRQQQSLLKEMGFSDGDINDILNPSTRHGGKKGAAARYLRQVERSGQRSGVLEKLIQDYDKDRRFRVHTASGETVVGNFELIESFADQAMAGDVDILAGKGRGESIESLYGVDLGGFAEEAESARRDYEGKNFGTPDDYEGAGSGEIVIRAGPELQRWIDITTTGSAPPVQWSGGQPPPDRRATGTTP